MKNVIISLICLILLSACATNISKGPTDSRSIASIKESRLKHRPFFKIYYKGKSGDTRNSKMHTLKLINNSSQKKCADEFLRVTAQIFESGAIQDKVTKIYNEYGVEIHLGGFYQDKNGVIQFDQIVQAHVPGSNYHKSNNYLYQVRAAGVKNPNKQETILDNSNKYRISFSAPKCQAGKINIDVYLKMLSLVGDNIENAIRVINQQQIEKSPLKDVLNKYY